MADDGGWNIFTWNWRQVGILFRTVQGLFETVTCSLCGSIHESYGNETQHQGHDLCAWAVKGENTGRWSIHCGYGSSFDMTEFWYINDYPTETIPAICDMCILRMLKAGTIIDSGNELDPYTGEVR